MGWQLFVRPITGLSDNNDFSKVFGPAQVCKAPFETLNTYFVSTYTSGPNCAWPSGFTSTEILFVRLARTLSHPFDLRASALVHLAILAAAMALFLSVTRHQRRGVRFLLPPLAIFMYTDVAYAAYLNSAYMDNASWVLFLLLVTQTLVCPGPLGAAVYAVVGVLLVFSKAQHAILGIPFAGLAAWIAWSLRRLDWALVAAALAVSALIMPTLTPPEYRNISLYNLIFYRLAPQDQTILNQLGLDSNYQKWIGTQAFVANSPLPDPDWTRTFVSQVSFADVALLYLRRPGIAFREIDRELHDSIHAIRPDYMANYRQEDGFPPHSVATRFSIWSSLKTYLLTEFPYLIVVLYAMPFLALAFRPKFLPLALTLAFAGIAEFAICTLADAIDTHRHLFLFHIITDALLLLTAGWLLSGRRAASAELP